MEGKCCASHGQQGAWPKPFVLAWLSPRRLKGTAPPTSRQGKTRYYVSSDAEERRYDSLHRHVDGVVAFAPTSREVGLTLLTPAATLHVSPFRILLFYFPDAHPRLSS